MPACVGVTAVPAGNGGLQEVMAPFPTAPGVACPGFVVLAPQEFDQFMAMASGPGDSSSFDLPPPADSAAAWGVGFSLVVGSYVIGWAVGAVVNFINRN